LQKTDDKDLKSTSNTHQVLSQSLYKTALPSSQLSGKVLTTSITRLAPDMYTAV